MIYIDKLYEAYIRFISYGIGNIWVVGGWCLSKHYYFPRGVGSAVESCRGSCPFGRQEISASGIKFSPIGHLDQDKNIVDLQSLLRINSLFLLCYFFQCMVTCGKGTHTRNISDAFRNSYVVKKSSIWLIYWCIMGQTFLLLKGKKANCSMVWTWFLFFFFFFF